MDGEGPVTAEPWIGVTVAGSENPCDLREIRRGVPTRHGLSGMALMGKTVHPPGPKPPVGVPAYAQHGPCDWNLASLHNAFLAIRAASFGSDSTFLSSPVKVAPTFHASTVAAQAGTVIQC